jgi:hypothetical protein
MYPTFDLMGNLENFLAVRMALLAVPCVYIPIPVAIWSGRPGNIAACTQVVLGLPGASQWRCHAGFCWKPRAVSDEPEDLGHRSISPHPLPVHHI